MTQQQNNRPCQAGDTGIDMGHSRCQTDCCDTHEYQLNAEDHTRLRHAQIETGNESSDE